MSMNANQNEKIQQYGTQSKHVDERLPHLTSSFDLHLTIPKSNSKSRPRIPSPLFFMTRKPQLSLRLDKQAIPIYVNFLDHENYFTDLHVCRQHQAIFGS